MQRKVIQQYSAGMHVDKNIHMQTSKNKQADVNIRSASCRLSILNPDGSTLALNSSLWIHTHIVLSQKSRRYMWKNAQSKQRRDEICKTQAYNAQHMHRNNKERD